MLSADVIGRSITPDGKLVTHRLMTTLFKVPDWAKRVCSLRTSLCSCTDHSLQFVSSKHCYVSEVSEVDSRAQTLTMRSKNVTLNELLVMEEEITYKPDPANPNRFGNWS